MRHLVFVVVLALLGGCPSAPRPILTDRPQAQSAYRFISVDASSDQRKVIETMVERDEIVARYATKGRVAYVVRDAAKTKPVFAKVPFRALDKATLVVNVARTSDINGWGVEVNGEVHRMTTLKLDLGPGQIAEGFALLQQLHDAPVETIKAVWPKSLRAIESPKEVALFELGYVIDVEATLVTGNPFDRETRVPLYGMAKRSAYRAL